MSSIGQPTTSHAMGAGMATTPRPDLECVHDSLLRINARIETDINRLVEALERIGAPHVPRPSDNAITQCTAGNPTLIGRMRSAVDNYDALAERLGEYVERLNLVV